MTQIAIMVAQRLALGLLTLFAVSLIIFLGVELLPGDITQALLGQGSDAGDGRRVSAAS